MMHHSQSGSQEEQSDLPPAATRLTRRERRRLRNLVYQMTTLHLDREPSPEIPPERQEIMEIMRLYRRAKASPLHLHNPHPSIASLLMIMLALASPTQANSLHQPFNWTVHIMGGIEKDLLYNVTAEAPSFTASICDFVQFTGLNNNNWLRNQCQGGLVSGYYICPSTGKGCADPSHFYCPSWGCETMAYGWSEAPNKDQHLQVSWTKPNWRNITLKVKNPGEDNWLSGRTYGLRLYMEGYDWGGLFSIQKRHPTATDPSGVGPNKGLSFLSLPIPALGPAG
ncbi:uncharacterized protein LOC119523321 [Choloepus didactylus]|uniref:uncharacterized protein LOC119523321 n=1 Tax=Choloepus didactylus TaxID=27675 RepID=UPI00189CC67A|nr:uncharacterized protein LOC119523321 [Choloepus didactylus]